MPNHFHKVYILINKELREMYATIAIRSFAISMIVIFVPIYLLQIGFSLTQTLLFFAAWDIMHVICIVPAAKLASRLGFKHLMLYSVPFQIVSLVFLYNLSSAKGLALIAVIVASMITVGIYRGLFFTGFHIHFAKFSNKENRGSEAGLKHVVLSLAHVSGPLIGGLLVTFFGFNFMFVVVMFLLALATLPLFLTPDKHEPFKVSLKSCLKEQRLKDFFGFSAFGIESGAGAVIWPIILFFSIFNEYTGLGFVTSLSLLFALVLTLIVGRFSNHHARLVLRLGAVFKSIIWLARVFVKTPIQAYVADSFYGGARTVVDVPFDALSNDKANSRHRIVRFVVFREIVINGIRAIFLAIMAFVPNLIVAIWVSAGAALLYLFF